MATTTTNQTYVLLANQSFGDMRSIQPCTFVALRFFTVAVVCMSTTATADAAAVAAHGPTVVSSSSSSSSINIAGTANNKNIVGTGNNAVQQQTRPMNGINNALDSGVASPAEPLNDRPIIGVLAQEVGKHLEGKWPGVYHSYIAASYVKYVEGGGARVVPIWIGKPASYYRSIMSKLNGVLFPGGATWFDQPDGYADAGRHIYEEAVRLNDAGTVMPIWGTCLGMELLTYITSKMGDLRALCSSQRQALNLTFEPDYRDSKLFGSAPKDIVDILANEPVTANFHMFCLTRENLTRFNQDIEWRILASSYDWNGFEFVSAMEHRKYPFYGVIFHPEKPIYEWVLNRNIPHTSNAIRANQYFAAFFVDQCRRNRQVFPGGVPEENSVLIYNYPTNFTGLVKSAYQECYMFDQKVDYKVPVLNERRESLTDDADIAKVSSEV